MGCSCIKPNSVSNSTDLNVCQPTINSYYSYGTLDIENASTIESASWSNDYLVIGKCDDVCGLKNTKLFIHSGTHYIEVGSLRHKVLQSANVKSLREICKNGEHYMAKHDVRLLGDKGYSHQSVDVKSFYVIKGNSCIEVNDLSHGNAAVERVFDLHPECQGGCHYFANKAGFYIVRNRDNTFLRVQDMSDCGYDPDTADRYKLHKSFTKGRYYFATEDYFYVLKRHEEVGCLVYYRTKDLRSNAKAEMFPVDDSVASIVYCSTSLSRLSNRGM